MPLPSPSVRLPAADSLAEVLHGQRMPQVTDLRVPKSGWAVLRRIPWHLAGVFQISGEAEAKLAELGVGYTICYGDTVPGSDKFVFSEFGSI